MQSPHHTSSKPMPHGSNPHQHPTQMHPHGRHPHSKPPGHASASNSNSNSSSTTTKWLPHEERLNKAWRSIGHTVVNCIAKADGAAAAAASGPPAAEAKQRELDEAVVLFLRTRREFHRLLSHTEAKLQGQAEEMESLETYVRTQPRIGSSRKRKR